MRYAVRMDIRAIVDIAEDCIDEERDHLLEIHELLEIAEDIDEDEPMDDVYQQMKFDLCPTCFRKFIKNPVGKESSAEFNFSEN